MKKLNVKVTFVEEALGTASNDPEIHAEYIASKAPDAPSMQEEIEAIGVDGVVEKGMTVFPRNDKGNPFFWDYQIKGFFKDTCGALQKCKTEEAAKNTNKLKAYKKIIDGNIFVLPRQIEINMRGGSIGNCQRPLRAQTAQGERVALANSETIPAGSTIVFQIVMLDDGLEKAVREWLDYGILKGIGQWRNSGKGRFVYELYDENFCKIEKEDVFSFDAEAFENFAKNA